LIERAEAQHDAVERERMAAGVLALGSSEHQAAPIRSAHGNGG
jgi:hypothetical protein